MNAFRAIGLCAAALAAIARGADEWLDRVDDALAGSARHDAIRWRLSGTLDLEEYHFEQPAPALIFADGPNLFNPRLNLYLDAQLGAQVYLFAAARADRGFDPSEEGAQWHLEEYALRIRPWLNRRFDLQLGKFPTVVGNWVERHDSWDNPFVSAPLPYENLTAIWDTVAARSLSTLLVWAHLSPGVPGNVSYDDKLPRIPVIWGPSYASGAALAGTAGKVDYAFELKNAAPSSRPQAWDVSQTQWQHPTVSGRLGYRPDERWNLGFSASVGSYLRPAAEPTVAPGYNLDQYREILLGQDLGFAWHHFQLWAELFEVRFAIPRVGHADTVSYYFEGKYKFTPQFFGALRWNQQLFGTLRDSAGNPTPWGQDIWRIDIGPGYRFTAHTQLKLQYSLQHEAHAPAEIQRTIAGQFTVRF